MFFSFINAFRIDFAQFLKANGGRTFVQLNSIASLKSFPDLATYSASKAVIYSFSGLFGTNLRNIYAVVHVNPSPIVGDIAELTTPAAEAIINAGILEFKFQLVDQFQKNFHWQVKD